MANAIRSKHQLTIRDGKGRKDRFTLIPDRLIQLLTIQLTRTKRQHEADLRRGAGHVELPYALARKYPSASTEWPGNGCSRRRARTITSSWRRFADITFM